jgi:hypothetical protein
MKKCASCGNTMEEKALFCSQCGSRVEIVPESLLKPSRKKRSLIFIIPLVALQIAIFGYFFLGKGCSKTEGNLVSKGEPVGTFTFTPDACRSGQRMQFYGAVILGKDKHSGAVVVIEDPIKGKIVKIEVPGSCQPPDYEKCKEVIIDPAACNVYDMAVKRTSTVVNDIRLVDGHLRLNCEFKEGGSLQANMTFENCD